MNEKNRYVTDHRETEGILGVSRRITAGPSGRRIALRRESDTPQVSPLASEALQFPILEKVLFGGVSPSHLQKYGFPMKLTNRWSSDLLRGVLPDKYPSLSEFADACLRVYRNNNLRFNENGEIVSVKN